MRVPWLCASLLSLLAACAGAAPETRRAGDHHEQDPSAAGGDSAASPGATSTPTRATTCDDGTCFACGEGVCPVGFFCDERAAGGAACAWLPECASKPSCDCMQRVLGSDCACRASGAGFSVECS